MSSWGGMGGELGGIKPHGTQTKYKQGCRCDECRGGNAERARAMRSRLRSISAQDLPGSIHGTLNGYRNYGCRCDSCKQAAAESRRRERAELREIREQYTSRVGKARS